MIRVFNNKGIGANGKTSSESELLFNSLNSITDGFFFVVNGWHVLYWNKSAEQIMQVTQDEIVGQNFWDVFPELTKVNSYTFYQQSMTEKVALEFEVVSALKKELWLNIKPFPFDQGLAVYFTDFTVRKKLALEVEYIKDQQQAIIDATSDAIWSANSQMELVLGNSALMRSI